MLDPAPVNTIRQAVTFALELDLRRIRVLVWGSLTAWAIGVTLLAATVWQDSRHSGLSGDVAAGMAGLAFMIGFTAFIASTSVGVILGMLATRHAPELRLADVALGLNVVTLAGVLLSAVARILM